MPAFKRKMPRAFGYGDTKRRRLNATRRSPYRRRRRTAFRKRSVGARNAPLYRAVRMGLQQPAQVMVKHSFVIRRSITQTNALFESIASQILPLQGNNVFILAGAGTRAFPNKWTAYSGMYSNVRVHGISIVVHFDEMSANADDGFTSIFYTVPGPKDGSDPADPYTVTGNTSIDQFHQEKQMRKKHIVGTGTTRSGVSKHAAGYFSVKRIQSDATLDVHVAELEVNTNGTAAISPEIMPKIIHKLTPVAFGGFSSTRSSTMTYKVTLYCQWYARRRVFEGTFTVA